MTPHTQNFTDISQKIVKEFLQSVVVVDDRAFMTIENMPQPDNVLVAPSRNSQLSKHQVDNIEEQKDENQVEKKDKTSENLDATILIDSFAEKGLVCAVIKPSEKGSNEELASKTEHAAHRADIVILDWQIGEEENYGDKAIELIKEIIEGDKRAKPVASPDRLRLFSIYTSNPDFDKILDKVKTNLEMPDEARNGSEIESENIKIVVYQKAGGAVTKDKSRVVDENQLPSKLINDFAQMTQGLLSNVVLKSLSELRENTHRLLSKFNKNLDAPYISHRVLTNPTEEAEIHPIPLITSEINDILEHRKVTQCISAENIDVWIEMLLENGIINDNNIEGMRAEDIKLALSDLIRNGLVSEISSNNKHQNWMNLLSQLDGKEKTYLSNLTELLIKEGIGKEIDSKFAMLTTLRSNYSYPEPILQLGSIVRKNKKYYVCIQPLCDSVRLTGKRPFPFLKLFPNSQDFDLVFEIEGKFEYLKIDYRPYLLQQIEFRPIENDKEIRAKKSEEDIFYFTSEERNGNNEHIKYQWIADLKYPHAQRIINEFSYKFSRVGLIESDWLRRMAKPTERKDCKRQGQDKI